MNEKLNLPDEITEATGTNPRDLVILSIPKMGKSAILGEFTIKNNAIVLDLEKGGYEYIPSRKLSTYDSQGTSLWESFRNYITYRNALLENSGKYDYLIVDGLSDLDILSEIGGTLSYMASVTGKKFNREGEIPGGRKFLPDEPEFRLVTTLPQGYGYQHTRKWFLEQIEIFKRISPYRIYAAHIVDKYIKDNDKEEVVGSQIALTGQLKRIFSSKVTSLCKMSADKDGCRYLNFDVQNDSIIAGSRAPHLRGKILISEMIDDKLTTFWENIYK